MKKSFLTVFIIFLGMTSAFAAVNPVPYDVQLPSKYNDEYLVQIQDEYRKLSDEQIIYVALDMMKGTSADFSRKALMGNNLTLKPVKIEFRNLSELNEAYSSFDAVGWKRKGRLYIYINPKHENAPPAALAALLAHEALHQDEYNSLCEETYAWTMEAVVWDEMLKLYPEANNQESSLVKRENVLKQLLEKGNYTDKYIKKTVYANKGYKDLPLTSPGFKEN